MTLITMDENSSSQRAQLQMRRLPASLVNAFMLNLALLLTLLLLLLKKLFPEIALSGQTLSETGQTLSETGQTLSETGQTLSETGQTLSVTGQKEVRRQGGFEAQQGDLVLELAKV